MRLSDAGLRRPQTKLLDPNHRPLLGSLKTRPRDRSNRLLDVSRAKVNARAIWNDSVEFFNFRIGDGDATNRPVHNTVCATDPTETVVNSVNHYFTARIVSRRAGSRDIDRRGVRNMERSMEGTYGIVRVHKVFAFWCAAITLAQFRADWIAAQGNRIGAQQDSVRISQKLALRLLNHQ